MSTPAQTKSNNVYIYPGMSVRDLLYDYCVFNNISLRKLSNLLGLELCTVSCYLNGHREPSVHFCQKVAELLNIPVTLVTDLCGQTEKYFRHLLSGDPRIWKLLRKLDENGFQQVDELIEYLEKKEGSH